MYAFERELRDQLFERHDLLLTVRGRPTKQREEVAKRGGDEAAITIGRQRDDLAVLALREFRFVRRKDERQVREARDGRAERLVDENLLVCVRQMILAANYVRDAHLNVVADDREVVKRMTIGA